MRPAKVLVVDDSPTIRKLIEISARSTDWRVHFAASGREGISSAQSLVPDVILLDFVLPDMKGVDVCQRLASDLRTAHIPILVVTAKSEGARELFRPFSNFAGWISKPFTADDVVVRVQQALRESHESGRAKRSGLSLSRERKEQAAKALYSVLKQPLASVPAWVSELHGSPAAPYLARKLLTPALVELLLESLLPVYRELLGETERRASVVPAGNGPSFCGSLHDWPLGDVLVLINGSGRTGVLTLEANGRTTRLYCRSGEVLLVTCLDPAVYMSGTTVPLGEVPSDALAEAETEQRASGKPVFVSLAEKALLPKACDLGSTLHHHSKRLLVAMLGEKHASFTWRDLPALPGYVDAYGRHVSPARDTLLGIPQGPAGAPSSLAQMTLERLRETSASNELAGGVIFDRVRGFSQKVRELDLNAEERKVLALVDGHTSADHVAARSGLQFEEVGSILSRLGEVGLLRARSETSAARAAGTGGSQGPVLILDPDVEGFHEPLRSLLSARNEPLDLVPIEGSDVLAAIRRERPRMVILNAEAGSEVLTSTAHAVKNTADLAGVSLVAVLDRGTGAKEAALADAGFDAVLVKPVAYAELERLMDI